MLNYSFFGFETPHLALTFVNLIPLTSAFMGGRSRSRFRSRLQVATAVEDVDLLCSFAMYP